MRDDARFDTVPDDATTTPPAGDKLHRAHEPRELDDGPQLDDGTTSGPQGDKVFGTDGRIGDPPHA